MKKLFILTGIVLLVLPAVLMAAKGDGRTADDTLWTDLAVKISHDAVEAATPYDDWTGTEYSSGQTMEESVANGETVYIGVWNMYLPDVRIKEMVIIIEGAGVADVSGSIEVQGYLSEGQVAGTAEVEVEVLTATSIKITVLMFPQPEWEVITITNNSGGTVSFDSMTGGFLVDKVSICWVIPTMTYYGLGILALLLIGSTVWVLRRKRVGSVA